MRDLAQIQIRIRERAVAAGVSPATSETTDTIATTGAAGVSDPGYSSGESRLHLQFSVIVGRLCQTPRPGMSISCNDHLRAVAPCR
jgi:hypothetical protein